MEKKNRDLVFVDLKEKYPDSPVMMGGAMMGRSWITTTRKQMIGYLKATTSKSTEKSGSERT